MICSSIRIPRSNSYWEMFVMNFIANLFKVNRFDVVFMQLKHVPILQNQAWIAVLTMYRNGVIARISSEHGVGNFVLISTRKSG